MSEQKKNLELYAKAAPKAPGVYLFKDALGVVVYVGKARNIYNRLGQYFAAYSSELKATSIINSATTIEWIETETELAALLLEARMIQSHQPSCNVLLKTGQPYYYFFISAEPLARFDLVRTKSKKGNYFGPFIDKGAAKRAFRFLQKEFQLFLCGRTIEGGCLAYHLGKCAGSCKSDFDKQAYSARIALLKRSLKERPKVVAAFFDDLIAQSNAAASFEYSAQLVGYKHAMLRVHQSLALGFDKPSSIQRLADRDVWVWLDDGDDAGVLALFADRGGVLKKERVFFIFRNDQSVDEVLYDYLFEYYRTSLCAPHILVSHPVRDAAMLASFLKEWHQLPLSVSLHAPAGSEFGEVLAYAQSYARAERDKKRLVPQQLKALLELNRPVHTIDCFDISHKQGSAMVGACVRFTDGIADHKGLRNFHIKTLDEQNDYAALQEIVQRRYKTKDDLPDVIVIDGGKGQLSAVTQVIAPLLAGTGVGLISLAKREETIFSQSFPEGKVLSQRNTAAQRLIALRDYAHHRAISFHRKVFLSKQQQ